ncbi:MAG TPA: FtsX-like permease family protein, partial [Longimicrobiales bacterium]|nr:FtsX-like permease family protein [Longimicrobiales bacterium]
ALVGLTTFAFGLAPALQLTRTTLAESMRHGGRGDTGPGSTIGRSLLLAGEVAFSVVLLLGAGLLLRSFLEIQRIELGFQPERISTFSVSMPATRYSPEQRIQFVERLRERLSALSGVESVAYMTAPPLGPMFYFSGIAPTDRPPAKPGEGLAAMTRLLDPNVIPTLGMKVSGRNIDARDRRGAVPVMLINRRAAEQFWPGQDPIGKQVDIGIWFGFEETGPRRIVGVVENIKAQTLTGAPSAEIYLPYAQTAADGVTFLIKSQRQSAQILSAARTELRRLDPALPLVRPGVLGDHVARAMAAPRFYTTSLTAFAAVAILLATIGIYGVVAYLVTQRRREIGVRLALGADIRHVVRLILWQGLRPALIGISAGLITAIAGSKVLQTLLYEVGRTDAITFALTPVLVLALVALACIIPARRASRTSPAIALRAEQA